MSQFPQKSGVPFRVKKCVNVNVHIKQCNNRQSNSHQVMKTVTHTFVVQPRIQLS